MHSDRFRTPANTKEYKENYNKIFGKGTPTSCNDSFVEKLEEGNPESVEKLKQAVRIPAEIQLRTFVERLANQIASQEELDAYTEEMGFEVEDCYEDLDFNSFWNNIIIEARNLLRSVDE